MLYNFDAKSKNKEQIKTDLVELTSQILQNENKTKAKQTQKQSQPTPRSPEIISSQTKSETKKSPRKNTKTMKSSKATKATKAKKANKSTKATKATKATTSTKATKAIKATATSSTKATRATKATKATQATELKAQRSKKVTKSQQSTKHTKAPKSTKSIKSLKCKEDETGALKCTKDETKCKKAKSTKKNTRCNKRRTTKNSNANDTRDLNDTNGCKDDMNSCKDSKIAKVQDQLSLGKTDSVFIAKEKALPESLVTSCDKNSTITIMDEQGNEKLLESWKYISQIQFEVPKETMDLSEQRIDLRTRFKNITMAFMEKPRYYIHSHLHATAKTIENDRAIIHATNCFWIGFKHISVTYQFRQIPIMIAYLLSQKCSTCDQVQMSCNRCSFAAPFEIRPDSCVQKWISQLPFAPLNHQIVRKQMAQLFK